MAGFGKLSSWGEWMDCAAYIGGGIGITLGLLLGSLLIGLAGGAGLAFMRQGRWTRPFVGGFVSLVRGTPLLLQLGLFYFALPQLLGIRLGALTAAVITFGVNSSAYVAEILRGGIESLPRGQFEAAQTLDIPRWALWRDIILPQVLHNVFPSLINESISLLKETALIATIAQGIDIMGRSEVIAAERYNYFLPLCIAGGYYYVMVLLIEALGRWFERRRWDAQA